MIHQQRFRRPLVYPVSLQEDEMRFDNSAATELATLCDGSSHGYSASLVMVINSIEPVRTRVFPSFPFFTNFL